MNAASREPWLVAGLGNPGSGYARHRHNVGHMVLDWLVYGPNFLTRKLCSQQLERAGTLLLVSNAVQHQAQVRPVGDGV